MCDVIPQPETVFRGQTGSLNRVFASPGDPVRVSIDTTTCEAGSPGFTTGTVGGQLETFDDGLAGRSNGGIGAIVVGLGVDYPIHVIERFDEERRVHGRTRSEAAMVSRDSVGGHMLAGMLTTAAGFGASCMLLLPLSTSFGLLSVVAIVLVYLASLFLLAVLLVGGWIHRQQ